MLPLPESPEFPAAMQSAREAARLTRAELAHLANVGETTIKVCERPRDQGGRPPKHSTYAAICRALGFPVAGERERITLDKASIDDLAIELNERLLAAGATLLLPFPAPEMPASAPNAASNLLSPHFSHTGAVNIPVDAQTRDALWSEMLAWGVTIHPAEAPEAWVVVDMCRRKHLNYQVLIATNEAGQPLSVAIAFPDAIRENWTAAYADQGVTVVVAESVSEYEKDGRPVISRTNLHFSPKPVAPISTGWPLPPVSTDESED